MSSIGDNSGSYVAPLPTKDLKCVSSTKTRKNASDMWDHFTKNDCENKDLIRHLSNKKCF